MWDLRSDARLAVWRDFRYSLDKCSLKTALNKISKIWSYAPFVGFYLHPNDATDWPDPWRLLSDNHYCDLAKTLGMYYTICLCKHGKEIDDIKLQIYTDSKTKEQINIVVVNNEHVLNWIFNSVVNKKHPQITSSKIKFTYNKDDLRIHSYY